MSDNSEEEVISKRELVEIRRGLRNVKEGKVKSIEWVAKELRVTLR